MKIFRGAPEFWLADFVLVLFHVKPFLNSVRQGRYPSAVPRRHRLTGFNAIASGGLSGLGRRLRLPVPRNQLIQPVRGLAGDAVEDIGQPGLWIDAIHLAGLCRAPNYAERVRFPQVSS
jgi:hypothetical protein